MNDDVVRVALEGQMKPISSHPQINPQAETDLLAVGWWHLLAVCHVHV